VAPSGVKATPSGNVPLGRLMVVTTELVAVLITLTVALEELVT
jgi:hypothetical protein